MGWKISIATLFAVLRDIAGLAGIALVSYGAWLVYQPAGFIAGGAILLAGAVVSARGGV